MPDRQSAVQKIRAAVDRGDIMSGKGTDGHVACIATFTTCVAEAVVRPTCTDEVLAVLRTGGQTPNRTATQEPGASPGFIVVGAPVASRAYVNGQAFALSGAVARIIGRAAVDTEHAAGRLDAGARLQPPPNEVAITPDTPA